MVNWTGKDVRNADTANALAAHAGNENARLIESVEDGLVGLYRELLASRGNLDGERLFVHSRFRDSKSFLM